MARLFVVGLGLAACLGFIGCGGGGGGNPDATAACSDGADNDGDTLADYPADPGCADPADNDESNPPVAQCADGRDNDGDGKVDYPDDPGCTSLLQATEADDCPSGPNCPECANGVDDDGDGLVDYPNDNGCEAASDIEEYFTDPNACGTGLVVTRLTTDMVTATIASGTTSHLSGACGGAGGEVPYEIVVTEPVVLVASTNQGGTTADTVLYLRTDCLVQTSELACNDDMATGNTRSEITAALDPGVYYVIVDTKSVTAGAFTLKLQFLAGEGTPCTGPEDCGPGLECRIPHGETAMVCTKPVCSDGRDDDDDGTADFPGDPGCTGPADGDETDDCPDGPTCPACANGLDDDGDGMTDYPADTDCSSASQALEGCPIEHDPIQTLDEATETGDLTGLTNDFNLTCGNFGGADEVYTVSVPAMSSITFDTETTAIDTVLSLWNLSCDSSLGCDDDGGTTGNTSLLTMPNLAAGTYSLVVAHYSTGTGGPFVLHTTGTIAPGGRCDGALATAGVIACGADYTCTGGVCLGSLACNNGVDDDGDGLVDYPAEPGCTAANDNDEVDDCPSGPTCPACSNGADDDGDGLTDYPTDPSCTAAALDNESCASSEPLTLVTSTPIAGTTVGAVNDYEATCSSGGAGHAPEVIYEIDVPAMTSLHVDTEPNSYDAVVALLDATCGVTPSLVCTDTPESFTTGPLAAGQYFIDVDGWATASTGTFSLAVSGVIANGASCEHPLAAAGAFTCNPGYACQGPPGSQMCLAAACNDAIDADGDGFNGYPDDPGCTSPSDADETDDCPSGPGCPACGNGLDDDGDGQIDYPADGGCSAASGTTEQSCPAETDPITAITAATTNGNTTGATNNFTPSCQTNSTAPDLSYSLTVPALQTLTVDTNNTGWDTVLTMRDPACALTPLACDDDSGTPGLESLFTATNVAPGNYIVTVDGYLANAGAFQLHVAGVAQPGAACTSPLFAAGALTCAAGETCVSGTCQ